MGVSGAAFRIQMFKERWCASAPHPRCGFDCLHAALDAVDWELEDLPVRQGDPDAVDRVRQTVASVESGDANMTTHAPTPSSPSASRVSPSTSSG